MDRIDKFLDGLEETFAHIREREGGDSVCGLCEYDGAYIGESGDWCNECPGFNKDDCFKLSDEIRKKWKAQLSQEGATKDTTSDTISRQAAIDIIEAGRLTKLIDAETVINGLKELPSAQQNKMRGRWTPHREKSCEYIGATLVYVTYDYWFCDACGYRVEDGQPLYNFCPNCGADMRGEQNE